MKKLILASSSRYRQSLLKRLQIPFEFKVPDIDESAKKEESPEHLVKRLSLQKAECIGMKYSDYFILGSDQVAIFNNKVIGKPLNYNKAFEQLTAFSGNSIRFITGTALINCQQSYQSYLQSEVKVKFRSISNTEIEHYLRTDLPFDCAGSFKVESLGISLFDSIICDDPTSLEGLPLINVCKQLRDAGYRILR